MPWLTFFVVKTSRGSRQFHSKSLNELNFQDWTEDSNTNSFSKFVFMSASYSSNYTTQPRAKEKTLPQGDDTRTPSPSSAHSLFSGTDTSPAKQPPAPAAALSSPRTMDSQQRAAHAIAKGGTVRTDSKADPHKVQAGSSLATKQRLAEANTLINPKAMKSAKASPVVGSGQSSLSKLSFKKNKSMTGTVASPVTPVSISPLTRQDPRVSVAQAGPSNPGVIGPQITETPFVRSPSPMQASDNEGPSQELSLPSSIR